MVGSNDIGESKRFYDAVMAVLGYPEGVMDAKGRCLYLGEEGVLGITRPIDGQPAPHGNGMTIGFRVATPELVDAWHAAGLAGGGSSCEARPGVRVSGERRLYLAYLRDPAGNKLCATHFLSATG
ncbi:VOC family protein [Ferrimonas sediminicola]|uniref:VOC family protein n=2 Tax=Ferrimonas sediminicola TaxID=2569538 RepID=A0A4U1BDC1_9GAMM|nr:VOC family protein [Ferrimonas sediminicola]